MYLTPEQLLRAYAAGIFPMAERRDDDTLFWVNPHERGVIPLTGFHVPRKLKKTIRRRTFDVRVDTEFGAVMQGCAEITDERTETWINRPIMELYHQLHRMGFAHSVETWKDGELAGGLYGVALGSVFFGESMFSRAPDASKVALVHLVARLRIGGFTLLDTQFVTDHLRRFGAVEIPRSDYLEKLSRAIRLPAEFYSEADSPELWDELEAVFRQSSTHTS